ncbi:MAG: hypothetical protein ACRCT7_01835 [Shewanella sp.]
MNIYRLILSSLQLFVLGLLALVAVNSGGGETFFSDLSGHLGVISRTCYMLVWR